jgi:hypothetical protein
VQTIAASEAKSHQWAGVAACIDGDILMIADFGLPIACPPVASAQAGGLKKNRSMNVRANLRASNHLFALSEKSVLDDFNLAAPFRCRG